MSWPDMMTPWAAEPAPVTARPARCTCTRPVAATLAGTLGCPRRWWYVPGQGWAHAPGWAR